MFQRGKIANPKIKRCGFLNEKKAKKNYKNIFLVGE